MMSVKSELIQADRTLSLHCAFAKAPKQPYFQISEFESEGYRSDRSIFSKTLRIAS